VKPLVGALAAVALGAVVIGTTAFGLHSASPEPPLAVAQSEPSSGTGIAGVTKTATLDLSSYPDSAPISWRRTNGGVGPHPDWVSYGPTTNLQVPANALVTVTINQYDSGEAIQNPGWWAVVHGTIDGSMTVNGVKTTKIDPTAVGHTFTIHNFPTDKQPNLFVSIPLPAVPESDPVDPANPYGYQKPNVITFQFVTKGPGTYAWNCEFPCGDNYAGFGGAMSSYGYMSGTLHVV